MNSGLSVDPPNKETLKGHEAIYILNKILMLVFYSLIKIQAYTIV